MMRSRVWFVAFAVVAWALSGCATGSGSVSVTQMARPSLRPQDVVGVVVLDNQGQGKKLAGCVRDALRGIDVRAIQDADMLAAAVPLPSEAVEDFKDHQWQAFFTDSGFRDRAAWLGFSHLIIVSVKDDNGPPTTKGDPSRIFAMTVETTKILRSNLAAVVVDLRSGRLTARVRASGSGRSMSGLALVFIVIPIPYWSNTSALDPACKSLGIGVADSMIHRVADPDGVRGCALLKVIKDADWDAIVKKVMRLRGNTVLLGDRIETGVYSCGAGKVNGN